ncbi:hypothetical protein [Chamaesiphon polymorphus]|uniref:Uncharacterized protein n=1 Tax=Chamaesiphon polymorphus CCALA 037 TaxID=2107692 RepID=A0A2T1FQW5_9CYAN|nr:hypothetical protein [Chamaesiphon polymorphus]PSB47386.1 hypothetical protein C7B77_24365 [Chamaesiphon polymorphus CCALA 037]
MPHQEYPCVINHCATNLQLLLDLAIATSPLFPDGIQFCAAVTPNLCLPNATGAIPIQAVAAECGWNYHPSGYLTHLEYPIKLRCVYSESAARVVATQWRGFLSIDF